MEGEVADAEFLADHKTKSFSYAKKEFMNYSDAEDLATIYSGIVGKPMLNKLIFIDDRKITSLLISSPEKIKESYSAWWHNGNNNEKAVTKNKANKNFEVFLISYDPSIEQVIYYLKLTKYLQLEKY